MKDPSNPSAGTNICFDCKKAVGYCSWSMIDPETDRPAFKPPDGAEYEIVKYMEFHAHGKARWGETAHITACPEFERDEPRKIPHYRSDDIDLDDIDPEEFFKCKY